MGLVLQPSLKDFDRQELEDHIEAKKVRRMAVADAYNAGVKTKLQHQSDQFSRKWLRVFDLLAKDLAAFDKAYERIQARLVSIGEIEQGYALVKDLIEEEASE